MSWYLELWSRSFLEQTDKGGGSQEGTNSFVRFFMRFLLIYTYFILFLGYLFLGYQTLEEKNKKKFIIFCECEFYM